MKNREAMRTRRLRLVAPPVLLLASMLIASADARSPSSETCGPSSRGCAVAPVPSLEPAATATLWRRLVQHPRAATAQAGCRPLRGVFYAATDWLRLATKLAANASPCAEYYVSIPPLAGDKTNVRSDQAWRIRALGSNFHALAEVHWTGWSRWVASTDSSWYDAGVEARRRMTQAGFDIAAGDTWAINEFPSSVRSAPGVARANAREFVRGLYDGDSSGPARGVVFIIGIGQGTSPVSVYQTNLQNWLADQAFWTDMSEFVSDWSQEVYGDFRNFAVPGTSITARRDYLNDYLQHPLVVAHAGPPSIEPARNYLQSAYSPLANAAWQYESGYGWTMVSFEQMAAFVSAQVHALRSFSAAAGQEQDHWGFAWQPSNETAIAPPDYTRKTATILDRLAMAIRDSGQTVNASDAGGPACGPPGQNLYCWADLDGAAFTELWRSFRAWSEPVLAFSSPPQAATAGQPSTPIGLALVTSTGTPQVAATPINATLTSSSAQGQFSLSASGPWTSTLAVTIPAGSSSAPPFYYLDVRAAHPQLRAAALGVTTATQVETVRPGAPVRLSVYPVTAALEPRSSQGFGTNGVDAYGNPVSVRARWTVAPARLGILKPQTGRMTTFEAGERGGSGRLIATASGASGEISTSASLTVSPGIIRVSSIAYAAGRRVLRITATVVEAGGGPVSRARTSVAVRRNGRWVFSGDKRTDRNGRVTYLVPLKSGCYRTTVAGVTVAGYRWDERTPANGSCR